MKICHVNTKNLFKINAGIEASNIDSNDIILDKMRHQNSQSYKIKVFNNNNIINNEDFNSKYEKKTQGKTKSKTKHLNHEHYCISKSSKKTLGLFPTNALYGKKNNFETNKKIQTKYTNTFKQMGKQLTLKNKRKSFLSQGYLIKRKNYTNLSKNLTINNDHEANNDKNSNYNLNLNDNNNNSSFLLLKDTKEKEYKEGLFKHDSKNLEELNNSRRIKKKTNLKKNIGIPALDHIQVPQINIKKIDNNLSNIKGRHKSVNFGNQKGNFLFSANLLGIKNMTFAKNPSENVGDSSKQVSNQKNPPQHVRNSKFVIDKKIYEDNLSRPSVSKNENNLNTVIYNGNTEAATYLKTIIQSKIKLVRQEKTQNYNLVHFLEEKMSYFEFLKFFITCKKRDDNNINLIMQFRKKLLSEEHLFRVHINLYLLEKLFQVDDQYKFDVKELYNNL